MRNIFLLFSFLTASYMYANAQITISNSFFPKAGDSLQTSSIDNVKGLKIEKDGINKTWNFSKLVAKTLDKAYIKAAKDGESAAAFPKATFVEKRSTDVTETYVTATTKTYEVIGFSGGMDLGIPGVATTIKVTPSNVIRRAPMNFLDLNTTKNAVNFAFPLSILPDSIKAGIGQFAGLIDSIRVKIATDRNDLVDGYGKISVPMGTFDVLREKRISYSSRKLEVYVKLFKSWSDISTLIPAGQLPPDLQDFVGLDTTLQYHFFANNVKEPIMVATMSNKDNTVVTDVTYKNEKKYTPIKDVFAENIARPDMRAYPNPATDEFFLELNNFQSGNYTLKIYNLLGKVVQTEDYYVSGPKTFRVDIENLRKGSYLYSISDAKGRIILTKRLLVLKV